MRIVISIPKQVNKKYISFTLYPARTQQSRQREPSVKTLTLSAEFSEALSVKWKNSMMRFASTPEWRNRNIQLSKYFMSSSGD